MGTSRTFSILLTLGFLAPLCAAQDKPFENPKVRPPLVRPQRRAAGESLPPLPLPATPLRRTERKRPPAPPALVGLIQLGGARYQLVDGQRVKIDDFPTTQVDIERLMQEANSRLGLRYRYMSTSLDRFSFDPTELPLLYITGWTPIPELPEATLAKLQRYLYDGGTLVLHAQCGRPEFYRSAYALAARLLPKRRLVEIPPDSPLFRAFAPIDRVRVRKDDQPILEAPPRLLGVYLGCRPAIVLSDIDLNCSWDVVNRPIAGGVLYQAEDGLALGMNLIATVLADFPYARSWGVEKVYPEQADASRDQLVIAQVVHDGDWDPCPQALPNLVKHIQTQTTLDVQFKRDLVRLGETDLFRHPVLYMTGLRSFELTDEEAARLRVYLEGGGVLLADAAAGSRAFDRAFRREIRRVLPAAKLRPIPQDSPIYRQPYDIKTVEYTDLAKADNPGRRGPALEGIELDGQLVVIYSSLGLACGWEQLEFPFNRGYSDADALRLGVNILVYALTH